MVFPFPAGFIWPSFMELDIITRLRTAKPSDAFWRFRVCDFFIPVIEQIIRVFRKLFGFVFILRRAHLRSDNRLVGVRKLTPTYGLSTLKCAVVIFDPHNDADCFIDRCWYCHYICVMGGKVGPGRRISTLRNNSGFRLALLGKSFRVSIQYPLLKPIHYSNNSGAKY